MWVVCGLEKRRSVYINIKQTARIWCGGEDRRFVYLKRKAMNALQGTGLQYGTHKDATVLHNNFSFLPIVYSLSKRLST
jgi:hypothetical protein